MANIIKLYMPKRAVFKLYDMQDYIIHSDSLFSALVNNYVLLYDDVKDFLENLHISSAFLGIELKDKTIYFLPKPVSGFRILQAKDLKKFKKVGFLSFEVFKQLSNSWNGKEFNLEVFEKFNVYKKKFLVTDEEFSYLNKEEIEFTKYQETRNILSRQIWAKSENVYTVDLYQFLSSDKVNLFFYFFIDSSISKEMRSTLSLFIEEGIGGDRSVGKGYFKSYKIDNLNIEDIKFTHPLYLNLSLIFPKKEELDSSLDSLFYGYSLLNRSGYIYDKESFYYKKPYLRKFSEGSILKQPIKGQNYIYKFPITGKDYISYGKAYLIGG